MNMNIKTNSKRIKKGDTFIALKGMTYDGHDYIEEAIENGAEKIICEHGEYNVQTIIVPSTKEYLNNYLDINYYNKIKDITLIGITGTNGKTTSCYFIYELLKILDVKCAYIGTIGFFIDKKERDLNNTTPEILELYEMFLECKSRGVNVIVMEVSSHALELDRVHGLKFNYVCFTNLTVDHLLFHKTMDKRRGSCIVCEYTCKKSENDEKHIKHGRLTYCWALLFLGAFLMINIKIISY